MSAIDQDDTICVHFARQLVEFAHLDFLSSLMALLPYSASIQWHDLIHVHRLLMSIY
jgi:hypothetical protein